MKQSHIFDIKRYAINDGPGIRVVVFFKGCNLHCAWCHNPESISTEPEKMYSRTKCILCGTCVDVCPENAIEMTTNSIIIDDSLCTLCGKCTDACPTKALEMSGKPMSVSEVLVIIEKEKVFFDQSGGGVTFSGGEPLMHIGLLLELLDECRKRGIHTAIDTAGNIKTEILLDAARHADLFLYDLKMADTTEHRKWTGAGNGLILTNLQMLAETGTDIIIRIPLLGGINDTEKNIETTAAFISGLAGATKEVHLLPYHAIAQHKYTKLGKTFESEKLQEPDQLALKRAIEIFAVFGIAATVGG